MVDVFEHAIEGIITAFREERNMKCHTVATVGMSFLGWFTGISAVEWALLVLCFGLVIGAEMVNTAIERTVDLAMPDRHPLAKAAKDVAAGAVLIAAMTRVVVGGIIFLPRLAIICHSVLF